MSIQLFSVAKNENTSQLVVTDEDYELDHPFVDQIHIVSPFSGSPSNAIQIILPNDEFVIGKTVIVVAVTNPARVLNEDGALLADLVIGRAAEFIFSEDDGVPSWTTLNPIAATPVNGATGATGAAGPLGPQGGPGNTGATGVQGSNGQTGSTGATGVQGSNGQTGSTGATGIQGPPSPAFFTYAFRAGNVEFTDDLVQYLSPSMFADCNTPSSLVPIPAPVSFTGNLIEFDGGYSGPALGGADTVRLTLMLNGADVPGAFLTFTAFTQSSGAVLISGPLAPGDNLAVRVESLSGQVLGLRCWGANITTTRNP